MYFAFRNFAGKYYQRKIIMKKLFFLAAFLMLVAVSVQAYEPWTKGGFETRKYRNLFVETSF